METNDSHKLDYLVFSSPTSSSVLTPEDVHPIKYNIIAPFLFTLMTMTVAPQINTSDISAFSQPVTVCQTVDIADAMSKKEIIKHFISKLVIESKDIDPEIAEIVNKNFKNLLW